MSAYLSYLADELTEIEERLMEPDLQPYSAALRRAVARAFELACEAHRTQRHAETAKAEEARLAEMLKYQPRKAA